MTAEFVAQGGDDLRREGVGLPRPQPGQKREGDDGCRHIEIDRLLHRPAPLTRILYVSSQVTQLAVFFECRLGKLVEPGSNHTAVIPDRCNLAQIELEVL